MTKVVSITMEGIQKGLEDSPVLTMASGIYHIRNDKHYIHFDEQAEDGLSNIKNMIKISHSQVEMTKKGDVNSEMLFDLNRKTEIIYRTSYGTLFFDAQTSRITVSEEEDKLEAILEYCLFSNDELISENQTIIRILSSSMHEVKEV